MLRMLDGTNRKDARSGVSTHPLRQGNSPLFIGLWWLSQVEAILASADFSKGRPAKRASWRNPRNCVNAGFSRVCSALKNAQPSPVGATS